MKPLTLADTKRMANQWREVIVLRRRDSFFEGGFLGTVERWPAGNEDYVVAQVSPRIGGIPSGKTVTLYIGGKPKEHGYLVELDGSRDPIGIYEF